MALNNKISPDSNPKVLSPTQSRGNTASGIRKCRLDVFAAFPDFKEVTPLPWENQVSRKEKFIALSRERFAMRRAIIERKIKSWMMSSGVTN